MKSGIAPFVVLLLAPGCLLLADLPPALRPVDSGSPDEETGETADDPDPVDLDGDGFPGGDGAEDDCDDADGAIHPGAEETCDAVDNDCDGTVDEPDAVDATIWYSDADGDEYGNPEVAQLACDAPSGHVADGTDCDDTDGSIQPGAPEWCNAVDDDCDGEVDEADAVDAAIWYADADGDGFGDAGQPTAACGDAPAGCTADASDCDDADTTAHPGGVEACGGGDEDCDGSVDETGATGPTTFYADGDGDGWGLASAATLTGCDAPAGWGDSGDCDDTDDLIYPGATPVCTDGADHDCDGSVDIACSVADALQLTGAGSHNRAGYAVAGAGDVDNDGYDDVLVGAYYNGDAGPQAGSVYLIFGEANPASSSLSAAVTFTGEATEDSAGISVAGAGDVDADGYMDLLIGAMGNADGGAYAGAAYLVLGGRSLSSVSLASADAQYSGVDEQSLAGRRVAGAGDVDADGYADLLVGVSGNGSYEASHPGTAYLVLGQASPRSTALSSAIAYEGEENGDYAASSVAGAGDVDGDGYDDMLVGADYNDDAGSSAGAAYLLLGGASPGSGSLSDALEFTGEAAGDHAGCSVAGAGDVDADGYADFLVGAYLNDDGGTSAGAAYLVLGSTGLTSGTLGDATAAYDGAAAGDEAGGSVAGAGDVDGDGADDLLVGADANDSGASGAGAAWLVFGSASPASLLLSDAAQFAGEAADDSAGVGVAGAGDFDGDGRADVLIGADENDDGGTEAGAAYLVLGGN